MTHRDEATRAKQLLLNRQAHQMRVAEQSHAGCPELQVCASTVLVPDPATQPPGRATRDVLLYLNTARTNISLT